MNGTAEKHGDRVSFTTDTSNPHRFLPLVVKGGEERTFEAEDMPRVLDFEGAIEAPPDGGLMYCEDRGVEGLKFTVYHFCLRGGFLFYFDPSDVDDESGPYVTYHSSPVGVVPLEAVTVEYPPGGRRVFREHAHTNAKSGYELVIVHTPEDNGQETMVRPPSFIVTESLGAREKWAAALRSRADASTATLLRVGYSSSAARTTAPATASAVSPTTTATSASTATSSARNEKTSESGTTGPTATSTTDSSTNNKSSRKGSVVKRSGENKSIRQQVMEVSDDAELAAAVVEFGVADFNEKEWMNHFFQQNNDFDAPSKCRQMENWQSEMKRNLKGAVLEQYEYFVQVSGEMTTMGHEVASLKSLIERQVETLKVMKHIDFVGASRGVEGDEIMGRSLGEDGEDDSPIDDYDAAVNQDKSGAEDQSLFSDDMSSLGGGSLRRNRSIDDTADDNDDPSIEIPEWLHDVTEEIAATMRECRYRDAIDLHIKARTEVAEILDKHSRPTAYRLTKKQRDNLKSTLRELNKLGGRISGRLEESLRRKNEALHQASKRERSDANAALFPTISPCALNDDAFYLQLLVKLGRNREAAEAYSARRSLLLLETLHERPISGAGSVDLVIYAAQLSQSFFSCLASSVEGFLDLFLSPPGHAMNGDKVEDLSLDASSLHSHSSKSLPAGAVASVVLWCDSELTKFANAFGGSRVLANLALSPPPRDIPKKPRIVGGGPADDIMKERKNALEVAAQCVDQAFMYASRNLDSVGLPLTPRLAECIRLRLKGCEGEVSLLLEDRWQHLTAEWRNGDTILGPL